MWTLGWPPHALAMGQNPWLTDHLDFPAGVNLMWTPTPLAPALLVALVFQFRARKYVPGIYWLSVVLISVVGTLLSDKLADDMGVPLQTTTIAFAILLAVTFAAWCVVTFAAAGPTTANTMATTARHATPRTALNERLRCID